MLPMTKEGNCCQEQKMSEVGNVYLLVVVDTRFCWSIAGGVRAEISKRVGWAGGDEGVEHTYPSVFIVFLKFDHISDSTRCLISVIVMVGFSGQSSIFVSGISASMSRQPFC